MRRWAAVAGAVGAVLLAVGCSSGDGEQGSVEGWSRLPAPPLAPRSRVVSVWTGEVALFVGGDTYLCPPGADCAGPSEPPFADGATFDPEAETWQEIAPSPVPIASASTAVIGDDVYLLAGKVLLRYSVGDDAWEQLPAPANSGNLLAAGEVLVAYSGSFERGTVPDLVLDPRGNATWAELPADPLGLGFDRSMSWSHDRLYLFDKQLVANPGSERPALVRAARLDLATRRWERLPTSELIGYGPWFAEGTKLVDPELGGADGGKVNGWGRAYPYGGVFDTERARWSALPAGPDDRPGVGVLGEEDGWVSRTGGLVLDLTTDSWVPLGAVPGDRRGARRNVVAAGRAVVAFGGERWEGGLRGKGTLLGDAWIWRPPTDR